MLDIRVPPMILGQEQPSPQRTPTPAEGTVLDGPKAAGRTVAKSPKGKKKKA